VKLAILTTQTPHHAYFVREVASRFPVARAYCETTGPRAPFETAHPFETTRDAYERQIWFDGRDARVADLVPTEFVASMNENAAVASLRALAPDVVIVFGTGRLTTVVLDIQPRLMLNLHGGDPEEYRGLDTHLWAIYHRDFGGLVTTLHRMLPALDAGDVVQNMHIPLRPAMQLHELRAANSEVCVRLSLDALSAIETRGDVASRRQGRTGRYYSFMPAVLKELCVRRFAAHTSRMAATADGVPA
jgi:methionyl-tRNA formyltransferase